MIDPFFRKYIVAFLLSVLYLIRSPIPGFLVLLFRTFFTSEFAWNKLKQGKVKTLFFIFYFLGGEVQ